MHPSIASSPSLIRRQQHLHAERVQHRPVHDVQREADLAEVLGEGGREGALQQRGEVHGADEQEGADGEPEALREGLGGVTARCERDQGAVARAGCGDFVGEAEEVCGEEGDGDGERMEGEFAVGFGDGWEDGGEVVPQIREEGGGGVGRGGGGRRLQEVQFAEEGAGQEEENLPVRIPDGVEHKSS